ERNSKRTVALLSAAGGAPRIIVSGATVSIVHACSAGVSSPLPARSIARTENVCVPSPSVRVYGEAHALGASPSTRHSNVAAGSSATNANVEAATPLNAAGADVIVVWGASP